MMVVGRLVRRVDPRILIGVGFATLAAATWMLGRLNLDIAGAPRARRTQVHHAALAHNLTPYDPEYQERLADVIAALGAQGGSAIAADQAERIIHGMVQEQATLLAFIDNFRLFSLLCLVRLPLLLFRKVSARQAPAGVH